ncbi:MAG: NAD(P)/FAD-dependent oxidoreductase [Nanoarchaeota archaeon]
MISIIGAGPAGSYTAYLLAKAGMDVQIFEEHAEIGEPVQCTGIVTSSIKNILKLKKKSIINEVNKVKVYSPDNNFTELKLKDKNIILDRKHFDNHISDLAINNGTKIFLNYKFLDYKDNKIKLKYKKGATIVTKSDVLIGADGPLSSVAQSAKIYNKQRLMLGFQYRIKLKNENCVEFYPFLKNFAWIVPENDEIVRLGVACYDNLKKNLQKFLKLKRISKANILEKQGGLIPIYDPKAILQKQNVYLVGDAATQVKATTGGGIIQGLIASKCLADSIINTKSYTNLLKSVNRELWLHLKLRNIMDKFSDKDWNYLTKIFNNDKNRNIIESFDRDHLSNFIVKLAITEPRLLSFIRYLI